MSIGCGPAGAGMTDKDLGSGTRMYLKRGTKFSLSLMDNLDFAGPRDPAELELMSMGRFELYMMTFR
ncbi:MAG TPA: hypothetical protein ENO21_04800 [Firmicutes bacterium]|nr:hypothetical protein [Bacillota bacterium]